MSVKYLTQWKAQSRCPKSLFSSLFKKTKCIVSCFLVPQRIKRCLVKLYGANLCLQLCPDKWVWLFTLSDRYIFLKKRKCLWKHRLEWLEIWQDHLDRIAHVDKTDTTGPRRGHIIFQEERLSLSSNSHDRNNTIGKKGDSNLISDPSKSHTQHSSFPEGLENKLWWAITAICSFS